MSTKKKCPVPPDKLALYDTLVATNQKIERKGTANPYTSLNGHMFSYMNSSGSLALRLPEKEREEFLKKYKTTLFEAYVAVMKEYVAVPDSLLKIAELSRTKLRIRQDLKTKTHEEEVLITRTFDDFQDPLVGSPTRRDTISTYFGLPALRI